MFTRRAMTKLGDLLQDEMQRRGLDKTRFADLLGWDRSTVSRWLSGTVVPASEGLAQIASRLDRPLGEIVEAAREDLRARRDGKSTLETLRDEVGRLRIALADREAELEELRAIARRRRARS